MNESHVKPENADPTRIRTLLSGVTVIADLPSVEDQLEAISKIFGVEDIHVILVIHHLIERSLELQDVKQVQTEQWQYSLLDRMDTRNIH